MARKKTKSRRILKSVGEEMRDNPPRVLAKTKRKFGAERAEKQRKAILLNKARGMGAHIPMGPQKRMRKRMRKHMGGK